MFAKYMYKPQEEEIKQEEEEIKQEPRLEACKPVKRERESEIVRFNVKKVKAPEKKQK